jgi:hypothetical protein
LASVSSLYAEAERLANSQLPPASPARPSVVAGRSGIAEHYFDMRYRPSRTGPGANADTLRRRQERGGNSQHRKDIQCVCFAD